ncbi:MAG: DUF5911 domain-containing protein, partial [Ectothiorhodospiraceae bacterium]
MNLELGVIGNGQISALVDREARIVWSCFPRFDGDPVFSRLVDESDHGYFAIELIDLVESRQYYLRNTAILCTELVDKHGSAIKITDFCPRFKQYGRYFRPMTIVRHVETTQGTPAIRVRLRPNSAYGAERPRITRGSNHARFVGPEQVLRLTTDAPLTHVLQEQPIVLDGGATFLFGPDESLQESIEDMSRQFYQRTRSYWLDWCRSLAIPFEWQEPVIRAAITLKLSAFEDTGAILAAMTTSVPEAADTQRNWDYRFCWLRDAYFVVHALNRLGATATMEGFLRYIINLVAGAEQHRLQPLYGIGGETQIEERSAEALAGYRG